jgi:hypothetical protein
MKSKGKRAAMLAMVISLTLIAARSSRAQDASPMQRMSAEDAQRIEKEARQATEDARRAGDAARRASEDAIRSFKVAPFQNSLSSKIRTASEEVRDAKDDTAKSQASTKLRELLDQCFSDDMTHRQKELESIEARLQTLQAQLEKRRAKKDEIIELAMKNALNDAEGLGLYSDRPGGPFEFNIATPVAISAYGRDDGNTIVAAPSVTLPVPPTPPAAASPPKASQNSK